MPRLWAQTIETHRQEVRDAVVDAAASLVAQRGLHGVTMSEVAEQSGIGRATLYKYFPDVESILRAWHERHVSAHLQRLTDVRDRASGASERLRAVLEAYALILHDSRAHQGTEIAALLHRGEHAERAAQQLTEFVAQLLTDAARVGDVRSDVAPAELAAYCQHALAAARGLPARAAVRRLVAVTMAGLRPSFEAR